MLKNSGVSVLLVRYLEVFQHAWKGRHFDNRALMERYESEFLPDAIELQETNAPPILKWVSYGLSLIVFIVLIWASVGKMDIVATANGRLVSAEYTKVIQALGTSKIKSILVRNGQIVEAGQLLIQLDDTEVLSTIAKLELIIPMLQKKVVAYKKLSANGYVSEHEYFDRKKELIDAVAQLEQAQFLKESMSITSPVNGVVTGLTLHTVGGVVTPGQALLMVVPVQNKLELDAYLDNKDIGFVKLGQEVAIKLEAFPFTRYGLIKGAVVSIAGDSIERPGEKPLKMKESDLEQKAQTVNNFLVKIALDQMSINIDGAQQNLSPGMVATAEIKTGKRRLISYVLSPLVENITEAARER